MNLLPTAYGATKAAETLVKMVNQNADKHLHKKIVGTLERFNGGVEEMLKMNDPYRSDAIEWWFKKVLDDVISLEDHFASVDIPITYLRNVLKHNKRAAAIHGKVLEALRDHDDDYDKVLSQLRIMRSEEARRAIEPSDDLSMARELIATAWAEWDVSKAAVEAAQVGGYDGNVAVQKVVHALRVVREEARHGEPPII